MGHHHHQNNHHHHHHLHASAPASHHAGGGGFHQHPHHHHHASGQTTFSIDVGGVAIPVNAESAPYLFIAVLATLGLFFAFQLHSMVLGIAVVAFAIVLVAVRMFFAQRAFSARLALIDQINAASEQEKRDGALAGHVPSPTLVRMMLAVPSERRAAFEERLQDGSTPLVAFATEATFGAVVPIERNPSDAPSAMQAALVELEGRDHDTREIGYRGTAPALSSEGSGQTVLAITFVALDVGPLPTSAHYGAQLGASLSQALSSPSSTVLDRGHRWLPADPSRAFAPSALGVAFPELVSGR